MKTIVKTGLFSFFLFFFVLSFYLGWSLSDRNLSETELIIERNSLDLRSFSQGVFFMEQFNRSQCDSQLLSFMSENLFQTGIELERLEQLDLQDSPKYILLKQRHNMNQVFFYTHFMELSRICDLDSHLILFFFDGENPELGLEQGMELELVLRESEKTVRILPMDYGFTESLRFFYDFFEVNKLPSLIVNFDTILEGVTSAEQILEVLER